MADNSSKSLFLQSRNTSWADKYGGVVPFYPQQRYIDKNLAPELGMPKTHLEALAAANQEAIRNGLLSPKLASKILPNILTENAMQINNWGYPDTPEYRKILEKAGLPSTFPEIAALRFDAKTDFDRELINAKLVHAMVAAKAALYGEDKAIERWNGKGKNNSYNRPADAANHAKKVEETARLLEHPKNKEMMDFWTQMSERYAKGAPQVMTEAPAKYTWAEENVPAFLSPVVDSISNAVSGIPSQIHSAQDAIRNWTAPIYYRDPFGDTTK